MVLATIAATMIDRKRGEDRGDLERGILGMDLGGNGVQGAEAEVLGGLSVVGRMSW
jgi:hypothetical protein